MPKAAAALFTAVTQIVVFGPHLGHEELIRGGRRFVRILGLGIPNKKVCDFPDKEDFLTPEAAYTVINRVPASSKQGAWRLIVTEI